MQSPWLSYVPYHVAADLADHPHQSPINREEHYAAVTLFADVAGFTAISEALATTGYAGAEQLTHILNGFFSELIDLLRGYSGNIGKFGGDAVTAFFPYQDGDVSITMQRVVMCALNIRQMTARYAPVQTDIGPIEIGIKIGLGLGNVFCRNVGVSPGRLEFIVAGRGIDACAEAEKHAQRGQVIVSEALLQHLNDVSTEPVGDGFLHVTGIATTPTAISRQTVKVAVEDESWFDQTIARFIAPEIAERIKRGADEFIDEHRFITSVFVSVDPLDYDDDPTAGKTLQMYFSRVIGIIRAYDGHLNKIIMGDKGSTYLIVFGAPVTHEDDRERALRCILDISKQQGMGPVRAGVASGHAFCGLVGSRVRREYTVIGDVVNRSARLMQASSRGQILSDDPTFFPVKAQFEWGPPQDLQLKGISSTTRIIPVTGVTKPSTTPTFSLNYSLPMVGRERDLAMLRFKLSQLELGESGMVSIVGDAGMGKSRLGSEVIREALARQLTVVSGVASSFSHHQPYLLWQAIWQGLFEINVDASQSTRTMQLESVIVRANPDWSQHLPLLNSVLAVDFPETPLTTPLNAQQRNELRFILLTDMLRVISQAKPVVIVLEDMHWADEDSIELFLHLGRNLYTLRVFVLMLARPPATVMQQLAHFPYVDSIQLQAFDPVDVRGLIEHKRQQLFSQTRQLPNTLIERIVAGVAGNPFFVDELMNYIADLKLNLSDPRSWQQIRVPSSLQALILSRIDQLQEDDKLVLRVASVIGRLFRASWVYGSHPEIGIPDSILERLRHLDNIELTRMQRDNPEIEYLFKHILTQQVVYDSISVRTQQGLHERVGEYLETRYSDQLEEFVDALAIHYGASTNTGKQLEYFQLAAEQSYSRYARAGAAYYYSRLLPLLTDDDQRARARLRYAESLEFVGQWDDAAKNYKDVIDHAQSTDNQLLLAMTRQAHGNLLFSIEGYEDAIAELEAARDTYQVLNDDVGLAQSLNKLSFMQLNLGIFDEAVANAQRQLEIGIAVDDILLVSDGHQNLGLLHWYTGNLDAALTSLEQARLIARDAGYKVGELYSLSNLAGVHFTMGAEDRAMDYQLRAIQLAYDIGYKQMLGIIIANTTNLYISRDMLDAALMCARIALESALSLGDIPGTLHALANGCNVLFAQAAYQSVVEVCSQTISFAQVLGDPALHGLHAVLLAKVQLQLSQYSKVLESAPVARDAGNLAQDTDIVFDAQVTLTLAEARLVTIKDFDTKLAERISLNTLEPEQEAEIAYARWRLNPLNTDLRTAAADLYKALFEARPNGLYRQRYMTLSGEVLPAPPPISELPDMIQRDVPTWEDQVDRAMQFLATLDDITNQE